MAEERSCKVTFEERMEQYDSAIKYAESDLRRLHGEVVLTENVQGWDQQQEGAIVTIPAGTCVTIQTSELNRGNIVGDFRLPFAQFTVRAPGIVTSRFANVTAEVLSEKGLVG